MFTIAGAYALSNLLELWCGSPTVPDKLTVIVQDQLSSPQAEPGSCQLQLPGAIATYEDFKQAFITVLDELNKQA